jgi:hypothetical protein
VFFHSGPPERLRLPGKLEDVRTHSVTDWGLGTQGWLGWSHPPDPTRVGAVLPTSGPDPKPRDGFYTSTYDPRRGATPWTDRWRRTGRAHRERRSLWTFLPAPTLRLYVIDSIDDYEALAAMHPKRWDDPSVHSPICAPNWHSLSLMGSAERGFDAVHVTHAAANGLPAWDVESTLWFRLVVHGEPECRGPCSS